MGLSIHYKGRLTNAETLNTLINEVKEIAISNKWDYFIFEDSFIQNSFSETVDLENLYGIMVSPEKSEPLCFSFLSNGKMCGIINFNVIQINKYIDEELAHQLATKTQYAGAETHKQLILLTDYISKKYLSDFECIDEGEFWETRNENLLKTNFNKYTNLIESFSSSIEIIPPNDNEKTEDYLLRIAKLTKDRLDTIDEEPINLSIEDENKFKKLKLEIEHDAYFGELNSDLPPEIESQFLDHIIAFEEQHKNAKQITIFEKIGKPIFKKSADLSAKELKKELKKVYALLHKNNINLDVHFDYENEDMLIYNFIVNDLFNHKIDDLTISGMMSCFIYEDFYPNHQEDIQRFGPEFWDEFLDKDDAFFEKHTATDIENKTELLNFRNSFESFKINRNETTFATFDVEKEVATSKVQLDFVGKIDPKNKIHFSGESVVEFKYQFGFWYIKKVSLV